MNVKLGVLLRECTTKDRYVALDSIYMSSHSRDMNTLGSHDSLQRRKQREQSRRRGRAAAIGIFHSLTPRVTVHRVYLPYLLLCIVRTAPIAYVPLLSTHAALYPSRAPRTLADLVPRQSLWERLFPLRNRSGTAPDHVRSPFT